MSNANNCQAHGNDDGEAEGYRWVHAMDATPRCVKKSRLAPICADSDLDACKAGQEAKAAIKKAKG